jgi:hypothetical protein
MGRIPVRLFAIVAGVAAVAIVAAPAGAAVRPGPAPASVVDEDEAAATPAALTFVKKLESAV